MKRSPLRRVSAKQAKENRIWLAVKDKRKQKLEAKFGWLLCEYCGRGILDWGELFIAEAHHNNHDRQDNTFDNCRIVHRVCNQIIEDRNVKDVPSLLED